ncbi:MAG: prepilin-type N-terminal cleavage/methylation domain-containing protein [Magnetococcales bacterium]|nr:prepilin-type N-terminal cleavage/methylation domain-containing protein [Magnetococcales bacterium]
MKRTPLNKSNRAESGFTLIELIMVIVILGILAAAITPQFLDVTGEANVAVTDKLHGDLKSTMQTAFGLHRARGLTATGTGDELYITNCTSLESYLDDMGGATCTGTTVTFPDTRTAAITAETNTSSATLADI